jgi:hypothetical protein
MWLVWEQCGMALREIGDFFGGLNYAAVAQRLRRLTFEDKQEAARLLSKISNNIDATPSLHFFPIEGTENISVLFLHIKISLHWRCVRVVKPHGVARAKRRGRTKFQGRVKGQSAARLGVLRFFRDNLLCQS